MKTIELIKAKCEEQKNEILKDLKTKSKSNLENGFLRAIKSNIELNSQIELKMKPLKEWINETIENSKENKEILHRESLIIFEETMLSLLKIF